MKKVLLALFCGSLAYGAQAQVCSPNPPDPNATEIGANPNPLDPAFSFVPYNHQNTIVLPAQVDNTITPQPNDSIALCGIRILEVEVDTAASYNGDVPVGFAYTYEVWQGGTQIDDSNDVITINGLTRICLRMQMANPPAPVNSPCDSIAFKIVVRGQIDLDGPGSQFPCADVPGNSGVATFFLKVPLCDSTYLGLIEMDAKGFELLGNYPNPALEQTTLVYNLPGMGDVNLFVTDATGRVIETRTLVGNTGKNLITLNTSAWSAGIYTWQLSHGGKRLSEKFSVVK